MYWIVVVIIAVIIGGILQALLGGYAYLMGVWILFLGIFVDFMVRGIDI